MPNAEAWAALLAAPAPGIAEPERGQNMQRCQHRAAICRRNTNQDVIHRIFCVLDLEVEESVFERSRIPKFTLAFPL